MKSTITVLMMFFSTLAQGYILPPSYFFQQWVAENKFSTAVIKQERDYLSGGTVTKTVPETIKIKRPGLYKWMAEVPGQEEVKILGRNKASSGTLQQQTTTALHNVITPIEVMMIYSQAGAIDSFMKQLNVDVSRSRLELVQKNKLIQVGDGKNNRVYISPDDGTMNAVIYQGKLYLLKYDPAKYGFYPVEVEIYENEILKERVRVRSIATDVKIPETEFESK